MLTKSELKNIFTEYGFKPLKRLGENYLIDGNIKNKIIKEAAISKEDVVLEIGPGLGALTLDLAESAREVIAVEKDKKAFEILSDIVCGKYTNIKLFHEDILKFDIDKLGLRNKIKVIGNLPYYITTPIMEYIIENRDLVSYALVMVQKEVSDRFMAKPGSKDYSSISCFVQYYTKPTYVYTVKRTSFLPVPEVDSSIVRFDILEKPSVDVKNEELFFRIIRGSFNQRRKTIINSLSRKAVLDVPKDMLTSILKNAGVDHLARPEDLTLSDFANIANAAL